MRIAEKLANEGAAFSAHLLIEFDTHNIEGHHVAVLEEVEGLSRTTVKSYMQWLLQKFISYPAKGSDGEQVDVKANISVDVVLDKPIGDQLNSARLVSVDLYKQAKNSSIDKRLEYYEKERLLKFRVRGTQRGAAARGIVSSILAGSDVMEYPQMRIKLEEDGKERTALADREKGDALLSAFQLRTKVTSIRPQIETASMSIHTNLVKAMKEHLERSPKRRPVK